MAETVGTARIDLVVNTDQFDAAINSAKRSVSGMSAQAQAEYNKLNASEKRRIDSLIKQADTLGFTRQQQILYNAALKNVPVGILDELKNKLGATTTAQQALTNAGTGATKAFSGTAKTARELQFATRGLPAQFTDIATSIASGQRPMLVLLQQGGQLKDMFGGLGPAVKAMAGYISGLINPLTLSVAGVAAITAAWAAASDEEAAFNRALIQSGRAAEISASQLEQLAQRLDGSLETTAGHAADVIAEVTASGRFTVEQIQMVAQAAIQMETATGQKISETIEQFKGLAKDPVEAILKLNEAQNFLTAETVRHIEELQRQGRQAEAASAAMEAYANTINERAPEVTRNLGLFSGLWHSIKIGVGEAGDAAVQFFRDVDREAGEAVPSIARFFSALRIPGVGGAFALQATLNPATFSPTKAPKSTIDSDQERARLEFEKQGLRYATDRARLEKDIADARALGLKAGLSEEAIAQRIAAIRADYARKDKSARGIESSTAKAALQSFEDQLKQEQGAIANSTQLLQAQYSAKLVTVQDYYAQLRSLTQQGAKAQEDSILGQIDVLKARNVTGKEGIEVTRQIATLEAELAKTRADAGTKLAVLGIQEADALKQRRLATEAYTGALNENTNAIAEQVNAMVARIGMGEREFEIQSQINARYKAMSRELLELARQRDADPGNADVYAQREAQLRAATDRQVQIIRDGYDRMAVAQANWANGATAALANFRDQAQNVAGATQDALTGAFNGAADVLADFVATGKANFSDLVRSEIKDFARMEARILLSKAFDWISGYLGGGATGGGGGGTRTTVGAFNANGGVYNSPSLSAYSGGVYDTPQVFAFARGAGVFGEAGPEAIMPLKRGSDGKLGVQASGAAGPQEINIRIVGAPSQPDARAVPNGSGGFDLELVFKQLEGRMASSTMRRGSPMNQAVQVVQRSARGVPVSS
jgi:lambda family phage tail tape measure protein